MSDIANEIYEHLRVLGTHLGSPVAPPGKSTVTHLSDAWHEIMRLTAEVERLRLTECERDFLKILSRDEPDAGDQSILLAIVNRHGGGE